MAYRVKISTRAKWDLAGIYRFIRAERSELALKWYRGLRDAMQSLKENPSWCQLTPEDTHFRHLLYGRNTNVYRVIFRIKEVPKLVEILHIRHGAQRPFTSADLN